MAKIDNFIKNVKILSKSDYNPPFIINLALQRVAESVKIILWGYSNWLLKGSYIDQPLSVDLQTPMQW